MSTKIWEAYRLIPENGYDGGINQCSIIELWSRVREIREKAQHEVRECMKERINMMKDLVDGRTKHYRDYIKQGRSDEMARLYVACQMFRGEYRKASNSSLRDPFDFDCSVGFRTWKGQVYLIPYTGDGVRNVFSFLKECSYLEDFHYQNQTDRPEEISDKEWKKRERVWDAMIDSGQWKDLLVLKICQYNFLYQLLPDTEMATEIREREKKEKKRKL